MLRFMKLLISRKKNFSVVNCCSFTRIYLFILPFFYYLIVYANLSTSIKAPQRYTVQVSDTTMPPNAKMQVQKLSIQYHLLNTTSLFLHPAYGFTNFNIQHNRNNF